MRPTVVCVAQEAQQLREAGLDDGQSLYTQERRLGLSMDAQLVHQAVLETRNLRKRKRKASDAFSHPSY